MSITNISNAKTFTVAIKTPSTQTQCPKHIYPPLIIITVYGGFTLFISLYPALCLLPLVYCSSLSPKHCPSKLFHKYIASIPGNSLYRRCQSLSPVTAWPYLHTAHISGIVMGDKYLLSALSNFSLRELFLPREVNRTFRTNTFKRSICHYYYIIKYYTLCQSHSSG